MNRKLKTLGLALVAVLAMAAISAASASAALEEFHAGSASGSVKGINVGEETFTVTAGTVRCKVAEYNGTFSASTVKTQVVKPTYKECTAFGFVETPIDVNGCEYRFNQPNSGVGTVDIINCTKPLEVTAFNCTVTVGNQTGLTSVTYTNVAGSPDDLLIHTNITNIKYTQDPKNFPQCTSATHTNGTYTGTNTVRAFNGSGTQVTLTLS